VKSKTCGIILKREFALPVALAYQPLQQLRFQALVSQELLLPLIVKTPN